MFLNNCDFLNITSNLRLKSEARSWKVSEPPDHTQKLQETTTNFKAEVIMLE